MLGAVFAEYYRVDGVDLDFVGFASQARQHSCAGENPRSHEDVGGDHWTIEGRPMAGLIFQAELA